MRRYDGPPASWYDPPSECDSCCMHDAEVRDLQEQLEEVERELKEAREDQFNAEQLVEDVRALRDYDPGLGIAIEDYDTRRKALHNEGE